MPWEPVGSRRKQNEFFCLGAALGMICVCARVLNPTMGSKIWIERTRPEEVVESQSGVIDEAPTQTLHLWHICLHWGGLGGQCRHIYGIHGVFGLGSLGCCRLSYVLFSCLASTRWVFNRSGRYLVFDVERCRLFAPRPVGRPRPLHSEDISGHPSSAQYFFADC